jgi:hypothetical protein
MDLIDRYVFEVARYLPYRNGRDVATELHSLLNDSLEQRAELAGHPPNEEMAVELLREFGEPEDVAARYDEPRYLIGPRLYPTFIYVALIIVIVPAVVALVGNTIGWVVNGRGWHWDAIARGIANYVQGTFVCLGLATLVFAVIERTTSADSTAEEEKQDWNPRELPPLPAIENKQAFSMRDVERSIWGDILGLVLLNVFPQWLGIPWGWQYRWLLVPLPDFGIPLPVSLLNVFLVCCLLLNVVLALERRWTHRLRWAQFGLGVFGAVTLAVIVIRAGAPLIDAAWLTAHGWLPGDQLPYLLSTIGKLSRIARGTLWGFLLVQIGTSALRLWRLIEPRK